MCTDENRKDNKLCFVIMPIGELSTYPDKHFKHVYEDILAPAIIDAGYQPKRADDNKSSSIIHVDIIRDIINAPLAVCDLSSRNPNVLFELGIRQAFDLPVVLVQEEGTPRIFDISSINTIDYRRERIYHEVIEDRKNITEAIIATRDESQGINSIIKLLEFNKAELNKKGELSEKDEMLLMMNSILNEVKNIKKTYGNESVNYGVTRVSLHDSPSALLKEEKDISNTVAKMINAHDTSVAEYEKMLTHLGTFELKIKREVMSNALKDYLLQRVSEMKIKVVNASKSNLE